MSPLSPLPLTQRSWADLDLDAASSGSNPEENQMEPPIQALNVTTENVVFQMLLPELLRPVNGSRLSSRPWLRTPTLLCKLLTQTHHGGGMLIEYY